MGRWAFALGGLSIWAAHFFLLYGFASLFPHSQLARILTLLATIVALAADGLLLAVAAAKRLRGGSEGIDKWMVDLGGLGAALSFVAVLWQAVPALIV